MKRKLLLFAAAAAVLVLVLAGCGDKGYEVSKKGYDNVVAVNDDMQFIADEDGKLYLFKQNGKKVFKTGYDELEMLANGYLLARNDGDYGYALLDNGGNPLVSSSDAARITDVSLYGDSVETTETGGREINVSYYYKIAVIEAYDPDMQPLTAVFGIGKGMLADFHADADMTVLTAYSESDDFGDGYENGGFTYRDTYKGLAAVIADGENKAVRVFDGDNNAVYEGSGAFDNVYSRYGRFFIEEDGATGMVGLNGQLKTVTGAGSFVGADSYYLVLQEGSAVRLINTSDDAERTIAGTDAAPSGEYLAVLAPDGSYGYYDRNLELKLTVAEPLTSYNGKAFYNSANGIAYDAKLNFLCDVEGTVGIVYADIVKGTACVAAETAGEYLLFRDGERVGAYPSSYGFSATGDMVYFTDGTGARKYFDFVGGRELVSVSTPVSAVGGAPGVYYATEDTRIRIFADSAYEIDFGGDSLRISFGTLSVASGTGAVTVVEIAADVTHYLDARSGESSYSGRQKTERQYAYFAYSRASGLFQIYRGYNRMSFSSDGDYFVASTISPYVMNYADHSRCADETVVFKPAAVYAGGTVTVEYERQYTLGFSDAKVMGGYLLVGNGYSEKHAIYTIDGGRMLVDAKFAVHQIVGNRAVVSFSDSGLYGMIELKNKGYKLVEDVNKKDIAFIGDFYCYVEVKDGISKMTLKDGNGKKIINKVVRLETVGFVTDTPVVDGKTTEAFIADNGKNGWKVIFLTSSNK